MRESKKEYLSYLRNHINGVKKAFELYLEPYLLEIKPECANDVVNLVENHDASKYQDNEFYPYMNYFYPDRPEDKDEYAFNEA